MKIVTAHASQGLFRQPVRVTQLENLDTGVLSSQQPIEASTLPSRVSTSVTLSLGSTVYVPRNLRLEPRTATKDSEVTGSEKVSLADFTKNIGIGTALAGAPLSLIPLSKSTTDSHLAELLNSYGFSPSASDQLASTSLSFVRSNTGQMCCLFMAGGLVAIGAVEAVRPGWTWRRKLLFGACGGLVLVIVALALIYFGIWGQAARDVRKAEPSSTKDTSTTLKE